MSSPRNNDVRMRGFARRSEVYEALEWIDQVAVGLDTETVALDEAAGRVLAADLVSPLDVPAFDRSAMDGFALLGAETTGAGDYNPLSFRLIGRSLPGAPCPEPVLPGTAVRIMTGAPLPAGADAVVPAEYAREIDGVVEVTQAVSPGKHVARTGEDIRSGTVALPAGQRLRPQDLGLIASLGLASLGVVRQPRVRLLVTGDELVVPGEAKGPYQIYDANSAIVRGLVARDGGMLESHRRLADNPDLIRAALTDPGADVILVSGGSSVGTEDHAPALVAELGELPIHGVAMRPSSPAGMGRIGRTLVFLLPGNPVSCLCAYDFFAGRAIRRLGGRSADWPYARQSGRLVRKIASAPGRVDYCRVRIDDGNVEPLALSGASILSSTTRANGFVVVPADSEGYAADADVTVYLYQ
jgi:molybdopterin molybdotransferase